MAKFLKKELEDLDAIMLMFKGTDTRFDANTIALLRHYEQIFGQDMWKNVVVEMSYWSHKEADACKRKENNDLDEKKQELDLKYKLKEEFGVDYQVPIVFIDPVFKVFHPSDHILRSELEEREYDIFQNQTSKLWTILQTMPKYKTSENIKAPDIFYTGVPWLTVSDEEQVENAERDFVVPCKIWNGISIGGGKNSDNLRWYFNEQLLFEQSGEDSDFKEEVNRYYY